MTGKRPEGYFPLFSLSSMKTILSRFQNWYLSIGAIPSDDDNTRLNKTLMLICSFPFILAGISWGFLYWLMGEHTAACIPAGYSVFIILSIAHFAVTKNFRIYRFNQLMLILLLPAFLMFALGGFINGSAVILWSLLSPLGAILFDKPRNARLWFFAFAGLVIASGMVQPFLIHDHQLPALAVNLFFVINISAVSALIFYMVFYFVGRKNIYQHQADSLLLNILPRSIVDLLKKGKTHVADHIESASILFADIVNFTTMSSTMSPAELVKILNEVFSEFDRITEKYGLEKIKTIGDCYMVASGVPNPRPDHADVLVAMALDIRDLVAHKTFNGHKLQFRIGINSGPVVAGVIGEKKFSYDLWGDTVNTASRMESHGKANTIQISEATYSLIKDHFDCSPFGTMTVKGKGDMFVYHVTGQKHE